MCKKSRLAAPASALALGVLMSWPLLSLGATTDQQVNTRIQQLEKELQSLKQQVESASQTANQAKVAATAPTPDVEENASIKWSVHGVVVGDFSARDITGNTGTTFGGGKFLPIFLAQYKDWLLMEGHVEFATTSEGETETSLEYAQLDARATDWLTVVVGKFLSPIGQFQQAQHPAWINKLPDRPPGFVEDGGDEPLTEIGAMVRGGVPIGNMIGTYAFFVGNGPRMAAEGLNFEGAIGDVNKNMAVGGRISLLPMPNFEIGISGMVSKVKGIEAQAGVSSTGDYSLVGADFTFTRGAFNVRGEYLHSHMSSLSSALMESDPLPTAVPGTTWNNFYVQASYALRGLTEGPAFLQALGENVYFNKLEPVVRYSSFHIIGFDAFQEAEENRLAIGLDYWFAPSIVAKLAYVHHDFLHMANRNDLRLQMAFGF